MKRQMIYLGVIIALVLCACEEDDKLMFDEESRALNLWFGTESLEGRVDSTEYNYAFRPLNTELDSVMFYVKLAGVPLKEDYTFELEATGGDASTVIAGEHYVLPSYVLKAGTTGGSFPIYLKNTSDFKNKAFSLSFGLKENERFETGAKEYAFLKLNIKDKEEKPQYWDDDPETYMPLKNFFGTYSHKKYQFIIKVTGKVILRVIYQGTPTPPYEISYFEAQYLQAKCRLAVEEYNNNPENPDRPLSDEYGPITF
ncbi:MULTISPECIES: DUF4843 domain-containing protein [Butyricimonas]|uniref:DUF4843 domain-containing protein n=1 Tax=Butyricimonas TaxID=574697 RepID=UPI001D080EAE|nr:MULTISPECIES: DUF4843 domain-containing protein [Butyricimonas]MCB6972962.1 DUF4843 domain-containing protein [Butyricimonas synergistica]MCG4518498.1 DUF4843 domain-containing protein [Butyricimonas sp. DFI.6.44]